MPGTAFRAGRSTMAKKRSRSRSSPPKLPATGPLPLVKMRLGRLPCAGDVWMVECRPLPAHALAAGERPLWFVLVTSEISELIHASEVLETEPPPEELWDIVA